MLLEINKFFMMFLTEEISLTLDASTIKYMKETFAQFHVESIVLNYNPYTWMYSL